MHMSASNTFLLKAASIAQERVGSCHRWLTDVKRQKVLKARGLSLSNSDRQKDLILLITLFGY